MKTIKKNLFLLLAIFNLPMLISSCTVNKIHTGAFNDKGGLEDGKEQNYLLKNDDTKIYGDKISWKTGRLSRNTVTIDGQTFKLSEIKGYKFKSDYYAKMNYDFAKRIVKGKINIYIIKTTVNTTSSSTNGNVTYRYNNSSVQSYHYIQLGDDAKLEPLPSKKEIAKAVSTCPKASEMINQSTSKLKKEIRNDPNYMNSIFEVYNNECNAVGKIN